VLVSAFIGDPEAGPARLVEAWRDRRFVLVVSPLLLVELGEVLSRPKFARWAEEGRGAAYVAGFGARSGKRWDESNVRERILEPAVSLANERLTERGLPPLPHVTPHTLRRTYVSIMLLATNFDVTYVQHQVGHAESRMTLDVYAQLLDRRKRDHGVAFDALLGDARSTLYGPQQEGFGPPFGPPSPGSHDPVQEPAERTSRFAGTSTTRPARFELATSRSGGERSIH
jgi:hypothetical protein